MAELDITTPADPTDFFIGQMFLGFVQSSKELAPEAEPVKHDNQAILTIEDIAQTG